MFLSGKRLISARRIAILSAIFVLVGAAGLIAVAESQGRSPAPAPVVSARAADELTVLRTGYPAEVLRVLDGDTFEARVQVWPGLAVTTKVRLRDIDTAELRGPRCAAERNKAEAARDALAAMLAEGEVGISGVTLDKYGGRVVASASTRKTADLSAALIQAGLARAYDGGRRAGWCGANAPS